MYLLLLLLVLLLVRGIASYHPHLLLQRYVVIKHKVFDQLLICQSDPVKVKSKNAKANRNKLTYAGLVFYVLFFVLVCFSVVMRLLPDIPCEYFVFEAGSIFIVGNTLNEKLPVILAFTLFLAECAFFLINTSKYAVEITTAKKLTVAMHCIFATLCSAGAMYGLYMAISVIVETI